MDDARLRIGLIGCGQWGLNYLRAFSDIEGCSLVAAADPSPQRRAIAEKRLRGLRTVEDAATVIDDPDIDAVVIATPATQHYDVASLALSRGKHVLVEKPMTATIEEAEKLRDQAERAATVLMVGHVFRHNPAVNYVRDMIRRGEVGDVLYLSLTRTNLGPIRTDVNAVWDLMTHDVSIVFHLLNRMPEWVSAQGACYLTPGVEDAGFATMGFSGGEVANIRVSWLDPRKVREVTVVGTRSMVVIDDLSSMPVQIYDKGAVREPTYESFGEFKLITRNGSVTMPPIPPSEPLKNQCEHFFKATQSGKVELGDAADGARVVRTICAINESIGRRGEPVNIEKSWSQGPVERPAVAIAQAPIR